jgi:phenylpropionate dioxygenase-like ring-hydroxylating dioxygenase large terminal subunit
MAKLSDPHLEDIRRDVQQAAALPLERAITLPRQAYVDEDYFRHEAETVLEADWLCVAHISQLKGPGSFLTVDLLDEPLMVIRDKVGTPRVLSRVCPHRAMDIMPEGFDYPRKGITKKLICPYHSWVFEFDGRLKACPEMQQVEDFQKSDWKLAEIRSEIWEGFVFVNLSGDAPPLAKQYADFRSIIAPWKAAEMQVVIELEWDCAFNWKVMIENWIESYHHLGIHNQTLQPMMPAKNTWTEPEHPHFIRCHLPFKPKLAEEVKLAALGKAKAAGFTQVPGLSLREQVEWGLYVGYPCFMFLTMRDRLIWYRLQPISADRCKLLTTTLVRPESLQAPGYEETLAAETRMLTDFHREDMVVNTAVQRGLRSSYVVRGRLSRLEAPVWLIQRYLAARFQGHYPGAAPGYVTAAE